MYLPPLFREDRPERLEALMQENALATLVTHGPSGLMASHIPLIYEPVPDSLGILHGRLARANPQWQEARPEAEALAIFHGPQAYVSPNGYPSRHLTGRVVPTRNDAAVDIYGRPETYTEPDRLRKHLEALAASVESGFPMPWTLNEAPKDYLDGMIQGIVGIDRHMARFEGKCKVSQNRSESDRSGPLQGLLSLGDPESSAIAKMACAYTSKKSR